MKNLILIILTSIILVSIVSRGISQDFAFNEKELVKKLKVKSKSLFVDLYRGDILFYKSDNKNLSESCLYDTSGNKSEDYPYEFNGPVYRNNYYYDNNNNLIGTVSSRFYGDTILNIVECEYDGRNNMIKETRKRIFDCKASRDLCNITTYDYDGANKLIRKTEYGNLMITYTYEYDSFGNLINAREDNSFELIHDYRKNIKYDYKGNILETINFSLNETKNVINIFSYDNKKRFMPKTNLYSDRSLNSIFEYKYDKARNKIEEEFMIYETPKIDNKSFYKYDSKKKLIQTLHYEGDKLNNNTKFYYYDNGLLKEKDNRDLNNRPYLVYRYVYEFY